MADIDAARELLRDSFTRLIEHADDLTDGLTDEVAYYRPTPEANTITWLLWHSARIQDAQLCDIAGIDQVWFREGWVDRFALDLPRDAHGYGHTPTTWPRCARPRTCSPATTTRSTARAWPMSRRCRARTWPG